MDAVTIITLFTPFLVFAATEAAQVLIPAIQGKLTLVVVPVVTILISLVSHAAGVETNLILQILLGLGSIFLDNLLKAIQGTPAQAPKS